jgi:hypothetical protein
MAERLEERCLLSAVVAFGSTWKYWDRGWNPGTNWQAASFTDSTWAAGPAQLGYSYGGEATVVSYGPDPNNKYPTIYYRLAFTVSDPSVYSAGLQVQYLLDDGGVVYVNGTEVSHFNMPAGTPSYTTYASSSVDVAPIITASVSSSLLVAGTNEIAVEDHIWGPAAGDRAFNLELDALPPTVTVAATQDLASQPNGQPAVFTVSRTGPTASAVTVGYTLGGTAVNGTDYAALPGNVTIPAGASSATVTINPTSYSSPVGNKTVTLALNSGSGFALGTQASASAVIIDNNTSPKAIVPFGANWKYWDRGTDQGTAWQATSFNDASWATGPAQLGYSYGGEATVVSYGPDPNNKYPTIYYRRSFTVSDPSLYSAGLQLRYLLDDGGVVYVNGTEVSRFNMPAGTPAYATYASTSVDVAPIITVSISNSLLVAGTNEIAVEDHIWGPAAGDRAFNLELDQQPPMVTVADTQDLASQPNGQPAVFTVSRTGSTTSALTVAYTLGGTAVNGTDYAALPGSVTIPAGASSATITISPTNYSTPVGNKTVTLTLNSSSGFALGTQSSASAVIIDNNGSVRPIIPFGANWKYWDRGTDQGTAWQAASFNDASWATGPAQLGYLYGGEATVVSYGPDPNNKYPTIYYRRSFTITNPSTYSAGLQLQYLLDDGGVVYINGTEVSRFNMPAGTPSYATFASTSVDIAPIITVSISSSLLVAGTNEIAVEDHIWSAAAGDRAFNLELDGPPPPAAPALTAAAASTGQINLSWTESSSGVTGFLIERSTNGSTFTQIASVSASATSYSDTGLTVGTRYYYRVRATSATANSTYSIVASDVARGPATHIGITVPSTVAAGVPFSLTVAALDAFGNTATGYLSTVHFSVTGPSMPMANYTFTAADMGSHTFSNLVLNQTGTYTLNATDTATSISGSATFTVANLVVPRPDHVVIVVEASHGYSDIFNDAAGDPYLLGLAQQGASFTNSYGLSQAGQPNYLALFSGSTQGVTDDGTYNFTGPNLGSSLLAAGLTFAGYAESLPSVGFTGANSGAYYRYHNPWVDFSNVPASLNLPFSSFPTNYSQLPAVSFVIPNFNDDMHDGTVTAADTWLQTNLGGYITWAQTHNSLLIITWDHDSGTSANQIPTFFVGPMVRTGYYSQPINDYNVLRTVEDMYGLPHLANDASVAPITNVWTISTVVRITATQPSASEVPAGSSPGVFTVTRQGPTANPLTVHYTVGGSAIPGTDYVSLSGSVTIPAGASSATITVSPLDDGGTNEYDESVNVFLTSDPNFAIASPGSVATVFITDNDAPNGSLPVTRFAVIGDYGFDSPNEQAVSDLVHSWNPAVITTTGDNNYNVGAASTIDNNIGKYYHDYIAPYLGAWGAGASSNAFFPSLGNHDWGVFDQDQSNPGGDQPYLNYFPGLPGNRRYYDVSLGLVHLFILDSDLNEPDGTSSTSIQAAWLQARLAAATEPYKLVLFHHPPYTSGYPGNGGFTYMQWPFQAWGATAVLNGKSHDYERLLENGFPYLIDGLGGEELTPRYTTAPGSQVFYNGNFGALLVEATSASITFQFLTTTGQVIDTYTITTPPTIAARSAAPGATGVNLMAPVTVQFSEAMNPSTISTSTVFLRASGSGTNVPATVSYSGFTATLTPSAALAANTTYQVTVAGSVTDINGNALAGGASTWSFTTGTGQWVQTSVADFSAGTQSGTVVTNTSGGEVQLASGVLNGTFTSTIFDATRNATWSTVSWTASVPAGTTLTVQTRSGNTATPDSTWSQWTTVTNGAAVPDPSARYRQYRVIFTSTTAGLTPILFDITFLWA